MANHVHYIAVPESEESLTRAAASGHTNSACRECARARKTCCQACAILITQGDLDRIRTWTGRDDFHEPHEFKDHHGDERHPIERSNGNWHRLVVHSNASSLVLKRRSDGDCHFLGDEGCRLPREVRPLICRIYPYYFTEDILLHVTPSYCPPDWVEGFGGGDDLAEALGVPRDQAKVWREQFYAELRAGGDSGSSHYLPKQQGLRAPHRKS